MPNPSETATANYINEKEFIAEFDLKTICGKRIVGKRLNDSADQTNRVILRFEQNQNYRFAAQAIADYFNKVENAVEV